MKTLAHELHKLLTSRANLALLFKEGRCLARQKIKGGTDDCLKANQAGTEER